MGQIFAKKLSSLRCVRSGRRERKGELERGGAAAADRRADDGDIAFGSPPANAAAAAAASVSRSGPLLKGEIQGRMELEASPPAEFELILNQINTGEHVDLLEMAVNK